MNEKLLYLLICLLIGCLPQIAWADTRNQIAELFTTEHGLSSTKVSCITQDDKGFIWIGTEDGLNKFDGYNFTVYKKQNNDSLSLISDHITALYTDSRHRLWVATIEGLQYYDPASDGFVRTALGQPDYVMRNNQCIAIAEDSHQQLWFVASGLGVLRYSPETETSQLYTPSHTHPETTLCSNYIRDIAEDKEGNIWFGSQENGLSVFNPSQRTFRTYNTANSGLPSNTIFGLKLLKSGNLLISTISGGVALYDSHRGIFTSYPDVFNTLPTRSIFCALEDKEGNLLAGTEGNGLMLFDPAQHTLKQHPVFKEKAQEIGDTKVHYLYEDKNGSIWVGMHYKGLCLIKNEHTGFNYYRKTDPTTASLSYGHIMGITTDREKNIWIATDGGGLNRYNPATGVYKHYKHQFSDPHSIPDNAVVSVYCDRKNRIWAGTYIGGLCLLDKEKGTFTRFQADGKPGSLSSNFVKSITEDSKGCLWLGTNGGGLNRFDPETKTFRTFRHETTRGMVNNYVVQLFTDSRGILWIGTYFGLCRMDTETETCTAFTTECGLSNFTIFSIAEDEQGTIWIGTQNGLNRYNPQQNNFTPVPLPSPGISPVINGMIPYKDQLWLSTNNGLVNFNPTTGQVKNYTMYNGLQSNEFILASYYKSPEGELFFGGVNGFTSFFPEQIRSKDLVPEVSLTNLRIFNQPVPINQPVNGRVILTQHLSYCHNIRLKHSDKSFTLEFTAPDTPEPSTLYYACRMDGFDRDWVEYDHTRRYATYTNLDPGTYTFHVKASNNPEVWGDSSTTLTIWIDPPLWDTWWARLCYFCLACAAVYALLRFAFIRIRERNELRIERLKVKQQEELSQAKMQFFTNISHEFRTPLTLIIGPLERMLATENDPERKQSTQMMLRNAGRLLQLINQILELRKAEQGKMKLRVQRLELVAFVSEALCSFTELASQKQISLTYTWEPDKIPVWYDPDMLDKCLYNLLSNAFKFTPEGGKVQVDVQQGEEGRIYLRISDTGRGMSAETAKQVFERFYQGDGPSAASGTGIGMHLTKTIVELHGGSIEVQSEEGKGSLFCLTILPGEAHFAPEEKSNEAYKPRSAEAISPTQEQNEEQSIPGSGQSNLPEQEIDSSRVTLLIVEDDEDMRRYIREELQDIYQIEEAVNGKTGLAKALKLLPDLIITDVMMPEMSGTDMCRSLKANPETCHIPIIILTAQGDLEHRIEGLETGADSYIPKPFNSKHLRIRAEKLIELRRSMKERFSKSLNMEAQEITLTSTDERLVQRVIDYIRDHLENPELSVEAMSRELGMSRTHLHRKLKALTGQSPVEFIKVIRMKQAAYLLSTGKMTVSEVGYKVGYSTPSYFSSCFNAHFSMSPTAYMEKATSSDERTG